MIRLTLWFCASAMMLVWEVTLGLLWIIEQAGVWTWRGFLALRRRWRERDSAPGERPR